MYAILVSVNIGSGHGEEAQAQLENNVLPMVKEIPGAVSGYWTRSADGTKGSSMVLFENEAAAKGGFRQHPEHA